MDGIVAAQEIIHMTKSNMIKGYLLKLDFEKIYDVVNWHCLLEIVEREVWSQMDFLAILVA